MGSRQLVGLLLLCACKAQLGGTGATVDADSSQDSATVSTDDAAVDAPIVLGAWGTPALIPGGDSTLDEDDATLSSNKLEIYFKRVDAGNPNLYVMTRASETAAWSTPAPLTTLNSDVTEESPRLSANDLTMYFGREGQIYKTTRASITSPWGAPMEVTGLNTTAYEKWAAVCDNGYTIVSRQVSGQGQDLFEGTEASATTALTAFNSTNAEQGTLLTADCLRVYFQSNRDGQFNIYMASRTTTSSAWSNPTMLPDFNTTTASEEDAWISTDQRTFVYASNASGNKSLYISTR